MLECPSGVGNSILELSSTGVFLNGSLRETDLWQKVEDEDRDGSPSQRFQRMRHLEME